MKNNSRSQNAPVVVDLDYFLGLELPPRKMLLAPWLPRRGLAMVHAYRGIGKTHLSLSIAYSIAAGSSILNWSAPGPAGVMVLDGEMSAGEVQARLKLIDKTAKTKKSAPFYIMTPDMQPPDRPAFNLSSIEDQAALEPRLKNVSLIVVDNIATLCRTGQTNDADSWIPIQDWALKQRAAGRSVLFIHHSGKSGAQRGTSAREDVLDTVIGLRRPSDYKNSEGARFKVHFEKARGFAGSDSEPIEASLKYDAHDTYEWQSTPLDDVLFESAIKLHNDGLKQSEIAEEVNRHKSTISRLLKRAREEGRIP